MLRELRESSWAMSRSFVGPVAIHVIDHLSLNASWVSFLKKLRCPPRCFSLLLFRTCIGRQHQWTVVLCHFEYELANGLIVL